MAKAKEKKRSNGEGSVYQRKDGKWIAALSLPPVGGQPRRKVKTATSEQKAKAKLREMHADLIKTGDLVTSAPTLAEWSRFWVQNFCSDLKPHTKDGYQSHIDLYLVPHLGRMKLDKIKPEHVLGLYGWMTQDKPKGLGLSPTTANNVHRTIRKMFNDAKRLGKITGDNPVSLVTPPAPAATERPELTLDEALHFLFFHANRYWVARYATGLCTGQRQGESLGLQVESVDIYRDSTGEITGGSVETAWALQRLTWKHGCNGTCGRKRGGDCPQRHQELPKNHEGHRVHGGLWLVRPKTKGSWRVTEIPAFLARILDRIIGDRQTGFVFTAKGKPMSPEIDYRTWRAWLKEAGLPPMGTHAQRHTASSLLAFFGADEKTRMDMLGHTTKRINRHYTHDRTRTAQKEAASQMGALEFDWQPEDAPRIAA